MYNVDFSVQYAWKRAFLTSDSLLRRPLETSNSIIVRTVFYLVNCTHTPWKSAPGIFGKPLPTSRASYWIVLASPSLSMLSTYFVQITSLPFGLSIRSRFFNVSKASSSNCIALGHLSLSLRLIERMYVGAKPLLFRLFVTRNATPKPYLSGSLAAHLPYLTGGSAGQ